MKKAQFLFCIIFLFALLIPQFKCFSRDTLYSKIAPSCVGILVGGRLEGSGVILDPRGLVITAHHVTKKTTKLVEAVSKRIGRLPLKRIGSNKGCDLALFSLPSNKTNYSYLPLAKEIPSEGSKVFLLGSPIFRHHLLLTGFVARKSETYSWYNGAFTKTFFISGTAAPGTSGGPWLNQEGEAFAIQVAGLTTEHGHQGVNKAVCVSHIKKLLKEGKDIKIPTIQAAVEELWGQSHTLIQRMPKEMKGLLFRQVSKSGVCGKAGIKDEDIMLSANGKKFDRIEPFLNYIRSQEIGSVVKFLICEANGENQKEISIKLAEIK